MSAEQIDAIVAALERGGVVVLPTDTVYGLAALATDAVATNRLFAVKGRTADVPLAVLCASVDQALALADPQDGPAVATVAARWWPGPLTLVLPRRAGLSLHLGEPHDTIGLRVPDDELIQAVAGRVGPIAATSANRHGRPTAATALEAREQLGDGVDLVIDGGRIERHSSTVIDATTEPWRVLREGPLDAAAILETARDAAQCPES
jgi:tRNA threonylcarbamoyl adenosine modification protein (Sua5/YciO/YrdC/YwlC family)